jgi:hypothetical protein
VSAVIGSTGSPLSQFSPMQTTLIDGEWSQKFCSCTSYRTQTASIAKAKRHSKGRKGNQVMQGEAIFSDILIILDSGRDSG